MYSQPGAAYVRIVEITSQHRTVKMLLMESACLPARLCSLHSCGETCSSCPWNIHTCSSCPQASFPTNDKTLSRPI